MQLLLSHTNPQIKIIAACILFVMAFSLMAISPITADNNLNTSSKNLTSATYSALEMDLAKIINKYTGYSWNQSQQKASRIVKLVLYGSDATFAIGLVLSALSAGIVSTITAIAGWLLKKYIKRKGVRATVMW